MRFDGFAGNDAAKRLLSAYVDGGRFPHALLIEGPEGSGRRTLAHLFAQAAVCLAEDAAARPCGRCAACVKAADHSHPDIAVLGGDGTARSFHVEVVRQLRETAYVLPNEAARRVLILTGAEGMTDAAQNALLKILEEPPASLMFILTCRHRSQLLPTIQSRVLTVALGPVAADQAIETVRRRRPEATAEAAARAVALHGGIIGAALRSLDDDADGTVWPIAAAIAQAVAAPQELALLRATSPLDKDKTLVPGVLDALALLWRDAACRRCGGTDCLSPRPDVADALAQALTKKQLLDAVEAVDALRQDHLRNMNHTLLLTRLCSTLRRAAGR